jgi:hypothetical protein
LIEENSWSPSGEQPSTQTAMDSLSVGPTKSETEAVKGWAAYLLLVEPTSCLIFTNKERNSSLHPLKHDKSSRSTIFKLLQHLQLISALHPTGNYKFWYYSRSRLLNNCSKTIRNSQDAWEMGKCDKKKPITHVHFGPKKTQGIAPQPKLVRMLLSLCGSD